MGLPSGVQWANCNIGGERPSDFGLYFSWGNIVGHDSGEGYNFSQAVYNSSPAAAISADLSLDQDAARLYLGAPWRLPSDVEYQELIDNCTSVWTMVDGVNGILLTSIVNGNKLFLPAAGYYRGTTHSSVGSRGDYWSSTYVSASDAHLMFFKSSVVRPGEINSRYLGFSVRAVLQT